MNADDAQLEIAHVLFADIVGYSKLLTNEQRGLVEELNKIVRETEQFRAAETAGKLIRLATGDGMALAFFTSPEAPVRCAIEIARALQKLPQLRLRMGIDSGPVDQLSDLNDHSNVAGAGINMAQRVMDCGDAGHILLSKRVAGDLGQYSKWQAQLHDLGEVEVKHGVKIGIVNFVDREIGNPTLPEKIRRLRHLHATARRRQAILWSLGAIGFVAAMIAAAFWMQSRRAGSSASVLDKSIAVLPFESLSKDEENAFFAGGVQDEVLTNLARIADLKVISRTSVMNYKAGTARNIREIAQALGVAHILEGSVQRAANRVRVTAQLIDARTDTHVWAEHYDRELADVFVVQSEIAQHITDQLRAKLSPVEKTAIASKPTQDLQAFENYVRARTLMETTDDQGLEKFNEDFTRAVQLLEQAVARDPNYAGAYWALSEANIQLYRNDDARNADYRTRAEAALKEAQRIAPEAGETRHAQARIIYYGYRDYTRALATLEEAAKSLPNSAEVTMTRGFLYRRFGRWQESFAQFKRATELNPQDPFSYATAGWAALCLRWWDEGDQMNERMAKRFPRSAREATIQHALSLSFRGDVAAGDKQLESINLQMPGDFLFLFYDLHFLKRDFEQCRRLLTDAAKYSELQDQRWEEQLQLTFVTKFPFDEQAAREAEKRLEERLAGSISREQQGVLISALSNVKMLLGKKEALRIAEESVEQHPVSEDSVNVARLQLLAYMYLYAGENDRALQTFAKLVQLPGGTAYPELKDSPALDGLRQDPRFDEILKQSIQPFPKL